VEICTPIDPSCEEPAGAPMRREPEHQEAYVGLRKAQVASPQILSAFDALAHWINSQGLTIGGPPRELYLCDFDADALTDEVCDVAFPIE
jgi:hypothetical protein